MTFTIGRTQEHFMVWRKDLESKIPGRLTKELNKYGMGSVLIFGCGRSPFAEVFATCYPNAQITAYDADEMKIQDRKRYSNCFHNRENKVNYTSERPFQEFDTVIAFASMHENPEEIADEIVDFMRQGSSVGVLDYDMKGISREDFFVKWGHNMHEKRERADLGDKETHRLHTSFGLEDCVRIMQERSIIKFMAEGDILNGYGRPFQLENGETKEPTKHFLYAGMLL